MLFCRPGEPSLIQHAAIRIDPLRERHILEQRSEVRQYDVQRQQNGRSELIVAKQGEHGAKVGKRVERASPARKTISPARFHQTQHLPDAIFQPDFYDINPWLPFAQFERDNVFLVPFFRFL